MVKTSIANDLVVTGSFFGSDGREISHCNRNHYFIGAKCPFCSKATVAHVIYREGDCIACGALCQAGLYGCNDPRPLEE